MEPNRVSPALQDRLGREAAAGLLELVDVEMSAWSERVLSNAAKRLDAAAERYDVKLSAAAERQDVKLAAAAERYDSISTAAAERHDAKLAAIVERFDAKQNFAAERYERRLAEEISGLRVAVVREVHDGRVEIIKWSFLFWVGQVAVIAGLFSFFLRTTGH